MFIHYLIIALRFPNLICQCFISERDDLRLFPGRIGPKPPSRISRWIPAAELHHPLEFVTKYKNVCCVYP